MKKILFVVAVALILSACGPASTGPGGSVLLVSPGQFMIFDLSHPERSKTGSWPSEVSPGWFEESAFVENKYYVYALDMSVDYPNDWVLIGISLDGTAEVIRLPTVAGIHFRQVYSSSEELFLRTYSNCNPDDWCDKESDIVVFQLSDKGWTEVRRPVMPKPYQMDMWSLGTPGMSHVVATDPEDNFTLFDLVSGKKFPIPTLTAQADSPWDWNLSPKGDKYVYAEGWARVVIEDLVSGKQTEISYAPASQELGLGPRTWAPDERHIALGMSCRAVQYSICDDERALIFNAAGELTAEVPFPVHEAVWSSDSQYLLFRGPEHEAHIIGVDGELIRVRGLDNLGHMQILAWAN